MIGKRKAMPDIQVCMTYVTHEALQCSALSVQYEPELD